MVNKDLVNRLLNSMDGLLPISQLNDEIKANLKETVTTVLNDLDVVSRDEFEAQQQVLQKTRQKIDLLEKKLKDYTLKESQHK